MVFTKQTTIVNIQLTQLYCIRALATILISIWYEFCLGGSCSCFMQSCAGLASIFGMASCNSKTTADVFISGLTQNVNADASSGSPYFFWLKIMPAANYVIVQCFPMSADVVEVQSRTCADSYAEYTAVASRYMVGSDRHILNKQRLHVSFSKSGK